MGRTHELRMQSQGTLRMQPQGTSVLPALGGTALFLIVAASLVMLLHPTAAHDLGRVYASLRATGRLSGWGDSVLRASVAAGCASATIYVLVSFGRGVARAPFLWLAPLLLGFGMAVMMSMRVAPPLPMPEVSFYVMSALALLGGGALLQRHGWQGALSGSLVLILPLSMLLGGYVQRAGSVPLALGQLSSGASLHAFVLLVMSVGLLFIAVTTRDEPQSKARSGGRAGGRRFGRHAEAEELETALEQARVSEIRVQAAEQRVSIAQQQLSMQAAELEAALSIQDDMKALSPRRLGVRLLVTGLVLIVLCGAFMGAFVGVYRPLQLKAAKAQALVGHLEQQTQTLTRGFESERTGLLADMNKARTAASEAQAGILTLQVEVASLKAAQVVAPEVEAVVEPPAPVHHKARAAKKKRVTARPAPSKPASGRTSARASSPEPAESNDDPIAGLDL